jgi:mannose-6-phosphate isomerase class I
VKEHRELTRVANMGTVFYRPWGHFEQLVEEPGYRVRRVFVPAGHTIPLHSHENRSKNIAVVQGEATIAKEGGSKVYGVKSNIDIPAGCEHSIANAGEETLVFVETTVGDVAYGQEDIIPAASGKVVRKGYNIEPLIKLQPAFKDYLWGGTKLRDVYGMNCDYDIIAEAWMMSAHVAGQSILDSGEYKGMRFGDYLRGAGKEALGWKCSPLQNFPLLVKFIDARDNLSVQVHPNDDYALERENDYGKNEMWYVMAAEEGAGLYVGFNRDVSAEEVAERVKNNTIMEVLNFYPTKPGDVYYIPAGTVHAIGAGNLICEIQQSSNCTYRLYDFDRRDKFGNPRELHLQKALDVLNFNKYVPGDVESEEDAEGTVISRCKYFEATVYDVKGETRIPMDSSKFTSIICMNGSGTLEFKGTKLDIESGGSVFVPAMDGILYARGEMTLTLSHV